MIKLISEEFCAPAKIVLAPGQGKNVRDVKVITRCFTPVARRISYLKCAKNLNLWDETLLGVAEAIYSHEKKNFIDRRSAVRKLKSKFVLNWSSL